MNYVTATMEPMEAPKTRKIPVSELRRGYTIVDHEWEVHGVVERVRHSHLLTVVTFEDGSRHLIVSARVEVKLEEFE